MREKKFLTHPCGKRGNPIEWVFYVLSYKAAIRSYQKEYRSKISLYKDFMVFRKREGERHLGLKAIFTGEMLKHILI